MTSDNSFAHVVVEEDVPATLTRLGLDGGGA